MIIGLTGRNASGKGEVAAFLKKAGFLFYSLSDAIRDEIQANGEPMTRENLITFGNALRTTHGASVLAERILQKLEPDKQYVIDSFRNPEEVKAFRRRRDFHLVEVCAPPEVRFERLQARARENDPQTYDAFLHLERQEESDSDTGQQLHVVATMADARLANDCTLQDLRERTKALLLDLSKRNARPDWDTYFMEIARVVSLRSNCMKRRVAALLVKDRRIIATGYNGTPRGVKNCNEGGCPRCNNLTESGTGLGECLCSHAEENAITQSAYHGVSIKGATLYTTFSPCLICTKMIINSGVAEVVYQAEYALSGVANALLVEAGIQLRKRELT